MSQSQTQTPQSTPSTTPNRRIASRLLRWCRNAIRVLLYLPLLLLILLAILIGTPFGSRVAVNLADILVPNLSLTYGSGRLNGQLALQSAQWRMQGIEVATQDLSLTWRPLCLLQKQVCADSLSASSVEVDIDTDKLIAAATNGDQQDSAATPTPTTNPHAGAPTSLILPIGIILNQGQLGKVKVRVDQMHFDANSLSTKASWLETGLRVNQLDTQGLRVKIPLDSTEQASDASPQTTNTKDTAGWPLANLPAVAIPMPIFVDNASLIDSELNIGTRQDRFRSIELAASYLGYKITADSLVVDHDYGQAKLDGHISLEQDYPMDIHLSGDFAANKVKELPQLEKQHLVAHLSGGLDQLAITANAEGHLNVSLDANIGLSQASLPYRLNLDSQYLMWPLKAPEYETKAVRLSSQGNLESQELTLSAQLNTPYHPWLSLDTQLSHRAKVAHFTHLNVDSDMGQLALSGEVGYGESYTWQLDTQLTDLALQALSLGEQQSLPETLISGQLRTKGAVDQQGWHLGIEQAELQGRIQDYPLKLQGDLAVNDQYHLNAKHLVIEALESQLSLSGSVAEQWSLDGKLSVPALSLWDPNASGAIDAVINVSGDNQHPEIALNANTLDFNLAGVSIDKAKLIAFYRPQDEHQFAVSLKSSGLSHQQLALSDLTLGVKGDIHKQKLGLQTYGDLQLATSVASTFDDKNQRFDAKVKRLNLHSRLGKMSLDKPILISWDNQQNQGNVSPFCWQHQDGGLCLTTAAQLGHTGNAEVNFSGDLGALLKPVLPSTLDWQGPTTLDGRFSWSAQAKPSADIALALAPGHVLLTTTKRQITAQYRHLKLNAKLDEQALNIEAQFEAERFAKLNGHLTIGVDPERPLQGNIRLRDINLNALADFTPQLESLDGHISSDLTIAGSLSSPLVEGDIRLTDGELSAAANPTLLDNIDLKMSLQGQQASLSGDWTMGQGKASLTGNLNWQDQSLAGHFNLNGDRLAIIQPPLAILDVSPALTVTFNGKQLDIKGRVDAPSGQIKIVQLPEGGVAESSDVVFKDSLASQEQVKDPIAITSQVKINVGDKLNIDGMGLRGLLSGTLELRQAAFKPPLLYGEIKVINGSYKFMGQTLAINAGEVQFVGPIEVPNLNIEASREIKDDDVTAGVRITGTPQKPVVVLFSNPAKEQAEILSYIIKGTGLNNNSQDQNSALMMGAALSLGSQLGGNAINNLGSTASNVIEKFGISNVQLDANDDGKVAISGFIGDDLMVKYGIGVFNPGYEMTVRYYLLSQLYLESVSGTISKTLDIYYNFNID